MQDVVFVWKYAKPGNVDLFNLVTNTESTSKDILFRDYQVVILTGQDLNSLVQRRTDFVTTEQYTYTQAMNISDAGSFQPQVRAIITVRQTDSNVSVPRQIDIRVVS